MRFWICAFGLFCLFSTSYSATATEDERATCSAYYLLLSVDGDQPDITGKQASKAAYAFVRQIGDNSQTKDLVGKKLDELTNEIPGRMTPENITAFRAKYDLRCKALLKSAWCEAYKGLSPNACVE